MLKLLFAAVLIAVPAWCQNQVCDSCRYGMVRVAEAQTIQINLAAPVEQSCSVQAGFNDSSGNPLEAPVTVWLEPGQTQQVQHKHVSGIRFEEVVPQVVSASVAPGAHPPEPCITDVEVTDDLTGFSRVLQRPGPTSIPPGPTGVPALLRFPPVGLAWGQGIRLNVVAPLLPPQPCIAVLSFADAQGAPVGPAKSVNLAPGYADTLELNSIGLVAGPSNRISLQPSAALGTASAAPSTCVPTVEVFDNFTHTDWIVIPPGPIDES